MKARELLSWPRQRPLALALCVAVAGGAFVIPQAAQASAFQLHENSAQAMGRAYAGLVTAGGDCSVVFNNPAGMTLLDRTCLQLDVTAVDFSAKFHGQGHDAFGRPLGGGNGGEAGTTIPVPALYWSSPVGQRWHFGAGFSVPFGFKTEYNRGWKGRYNAIKSDFQSLDATLSASFDVTDTFTLGASAIYQRTSAELSNAINYNMVGVGVVRDAAAAGKIPAQQAPQLIQAFQAQVPPGSDGLASIKGHDWAWGWQLGAMWQFSPDDRFALDYRSKIDHTLGGTANFTMPNNVKSLLSSPTVQQLIGGGNGMPFQHTTARAGFTTPATANASYWHEAENFGVGVDVSWTHWETFKQLRVDFANPAQPATAQQYDWRDTWFAAVGGDWYVNDQFTLRAGLAVDTTPTHVSTRAPRVPDSTRQLASIGMGYRFNDNVRLEAAYTHIFVNEAHISDVRSSTGDSLSGNFDDSGDMLGVELGINF